MSSPGYTDAEIAAIGGWLKEGLSAGKIVGAFYAEFQRPVSRNAVIGIVNRNAMLNAIGFARRGHGGKADAQPAKRVADKGATAKFGAHAGTGYLPARLRAHLITEPLDRKANGSFAPAPPRRQHVASLRSVDDMISGRSAPMPTHAGEPRTLAELANRQCRFPVSGAGAATLFCASAVTPNDWMPGFSGGCYCQFHRALTTRAPGSEAA